MGLDNKNDGITDAFEPQIRGVEMALEDQFKPKAGADIKKNLAILQRLYKMDRFNLEAFLSSASIISLNQPAYDRLKQKMLELIKANEGAEKIDK